MQIDLSLRDAQILLGMLKKRIESLKGLENEQYPTRKDDERLVNILTAPSDAHWNK